MIMSSSTLTGSGFERGLQYGAQWRGDLRGYKPYLPYASYWRSHELHKTEIKNRHLNALEKAFPDIAGEIHGMAKAAEVSEERLLDLILLDGFSWGFNENYTPDNEAMCTNLSITGNCAQPILTQTIDSPCGALEFVHQIYPADGYKHMYIGRLGSVFATCGCNEKGLAMGCVSILSDKNDLDGILCGTLVKACLQYCTNVSEAVDLFAQYHIMVGCYTVNCADAAGGNAVIEKSSEDQAVRNGDGSYMYNTKLVTKFMYEKYAANQTDVWEKRGYDRLDTFKRLMESEAAPYSTETAIRVISDHSAKGPIWDWSTRLGAIILPVEKKMMIYLGPPDITTCEEVFL